MKVTHFFLFCCVSLAFTFASVYLVDARAPKTEKIVFSSNRRGNWDIYVMNADGSNQVRLTKNPLVDVSPSGRRRVNRFFLSLVRAVRWISM